MTMVILPGSANNINSKDASASPTTPQSKTAPTTTANNNKVGTARPRPPALWGVNECKLWFTRHCGELGVQYSELFLKNNVNGRCLLRLNPSALERMGIGSPLHRQEIWREIIKLKLKSDILEIRDCESQLAAYK